MSAFLMLSLLSDIELKLTFSVLPINSLNVSVVICLFQSFPICLVVELVFCECVVFVTMICNDVL